MLFGKINPPAQVIKQTTPFQTETITCEWMTAIARPLPLGAQIVNFQVSYGNVTQDQQGQYVGFNNFFNDNVTLSGSVITNWGTNDAVILDAIAEEQGTEVTETINIDGSIFI